MIDHQRDGRGRFPPRRWLTHRGLALGCLTCILPVAVATTAFLVWPSAPTATLTALTQQPAVSTPLPANTSQPGGDPAPASPPSTLKVIDYSRAPAGFPADPNPASTTWLKEGAHPTAKIVAYDAPGGTPRAYLAPTISGVSLTMPIVERRGGWTAVILPSANRSIAWVAQQGWTTVALRDQLVVRRSTHQLTWLRDGVPQQTWSATLGEPKTPTPLGRTFVLGRSTLQGKVYAGLDVIALGSVPDDANSVPTSLRGAHIGIHSWYTSDSFGKSVSNGCIRVPQAAQRLLLAEVVPGTAVVVVD